MILAATRRGCGDDRVEARASVQEAVRPKIDSVPRSRVSDPVTYTAVLPIGEHTAVRLAQLLAGEQRKRRTRRGRRALGPWRQAVLVLRWFLDGTRVAQLAVDNQISLSTGYRYLHEGIDVLAAAAPGLQGALLAAKLAGHTHVGLDGTLIRTDRSKAAGPPRPPTGERWICGGRASTTITAGTSRS